MADSAQDRQLPATERRRRRAREEGQVARSRDLSHFAVLGIGVAALAALAGPLTDGSRELLAAGLRFDARALADPRTMLAVLGVLGGRMLAILLPLLAAAAALAVAVGVLCGGWNFTWQPLAPKLSKLNPLAGLARVLSLAQLGETLKACLLAVLLGGAAAWVLRRQWWRYAELLSMPLPAALAEAGRTVLQGLIALGVLLALAALADVPLQRWLLSRRLRMSQVEVKQEHKETEGSPEIKSRQRQRQRELAGRRMLAAVPAADLVVMNPTHYAVALKYDDATMAAPRVVAKGADLLALRIRDIAREAGVPVLQAPALARALYAHTELEQEVPARLFSAVAQVLAWVYQLRRAAVDARLAVPPQPQPEVPPELDPANPAARRPGRGADGAAGGGGGTAP